MVGMSARPVSTGFEVDFRPMLTLGLNDGSQMDPETGDIVEDGVEFEAGDLDPAIGIPVDPRHTFSDQIYAMIWGMSSFTSNYSTRYVDQGRIWELNSGAVPTLGEGFEYQQFCDPNPEGTGKCYVTMVPLDYDIRTVGAEFVERGQGFVADYEAALAADNSADANSALNEINSLLRDINIVISVSEVFQRVF